MCAYSTDCLSPGQRNERECPFSCGTFSCGGTHAIVCFLPRWEWQEIPPSSCFPLPSSPRKLLPGLSPVQPQVQKLDKYRYMLLTCVSSEIILQYWGQNRCTYHLNDAFPNTACVKGFKMFFQSFLFLPCPRAVPVPMSDSTVCSLLRGEEGVAKYSPVSCPTPPPSVQRERERQESSSQRTPPTCPLPPSTLQRCRCSKRNLKSTAMQCY